jgi:hypothetical protein
MAGWFSAAAADRADRAAAKITKLQYLGQYARALLFEGNEGLRQRALPVLTYAYVRIIGTKKENYQIAPCESHTRLGSATCFSQEQGICMECGADASSASSIGIGGTIAHPPPTRPGELHPEPLTAPDVSLSTYPARATH